jgi:hypothetical protein
MVHSFILIIALELVVSVTTLTESTLKCWRLKNVEVKRYKIDTESATKSIEGAALSFECVDHIHSRNGFSPGVFSVGNCVSHDVLEETFQNLA